MSQVVNRPAVLSGGIEEVEHQEGQGECSQLDSCVCVASLVHDELSDALGSLSVVWHHIDGGQLGLAGPSYRHELVEAG